MFDFSKRGTNALWPNLSAHVPAHFTVHPRGRARQRVSSYLFVERYVQMLSFGLSYRQVSDDLLSADALRRRFGELATSDAFVHGEESALLGYDRAIGLDLSNLNLVGMPWRGNATGRPPRTVAKWLILTDGNGIPLGVAPEPIGAHDSSRLRVLLERLKLFGTYRSHRSVIRLGQGCEHPTVVNLLNASGCKIALQETSQPLQAGQRWSVDPAYSRFRHLRELGRMTESRPMRADAWMRLANIVLIAREAHKVAGS